MFYEDPLILYNYSAEKILYRTTTRQTLFGLICEANKIKQNITFYDKKKQQQPTVQQFILTLLHSLYRTGEIFNERFKMMDHFFRAISIFAGRVGLETM